MAHCQSLLSCTKFPWIWLYGNPFSISSYLYFHSSCSQTEWNNEHIKMSCEFSEMPTSRSLWLPDCQGQLKLFESILLLWINSPNMVNDDGWEEAWKPGWCFVLLLQKSACLPLHLSFPWAIKADVDFIPSKKGKNKKQKQKNLWGESVPSMVFGCLPERQSACAVELLLA